MGFYQNTGYFKWSVSVIEAMVESGENIKPDDARLMYKELDQHCREGAISQNQCSYLQSKLQNFF